MTPPEIVRPTRVAALSLASALGPEGAMYGAGDSERGLLLIGRPFGRAVRPRIEASLEALSPPAILPIDCGGTRLVDASFGDEVFVRLSKLRASGLYPGRWWVLTGVGEEMEENLGMVCRLAGVAIPSDRGVVGEIGPELRVTLEVAREDGWVTSRRLVERAGDGRLALTAASNRLTRLEEMGLLAPAEARGLEGGGRQKVYVPIL